MTQTLKVSSVNNHQVKRDGSACLDEGQLRKPLGSRMMMDARLTSLRELQSEMQEELDALLPPPNGVGSQSVLGPSGGAFKPLQGATRGEL